MCLKERERSIRYIGSNSWRYLISWLLILFIIDMLRQWERRHLHRYSSLRLLLLFASRGIILYRNSICLVIMIENCGFRKNDTLTHTVNWVTRESVCWEEAIVGQRCSTHGHMRHLSDVTHSVRRRGVSVFLDPCVCEIYCTSCSSCCLKWVSWS